MYETELKKVNKQKDVEKQVSFLFKKTTTKV
jgi:hypothetical protein